jgi:hypothetical protein
MLHESLSISCLFIVLVNNALLSHELTFVCTLEGPTDCTWFKKSPNPAFLWG